MTTIQKITQITLLAVAPMIGNLALAQGTTPVAETPKVVENFLPSSSMIQGNLVSIKSDDRMTAELQKLDSKLPSLPPAERDAYLQSIKPGYPAPYNEKLFTTEEYENYMSIWRAGQLEEGPSVGIKVTAADQAKTQWRVVAITAQGSPLPLSSLNYNSAKNEWTSPNGSLTFKGAVSFTNDHQLGEGSGYEWGLKEKDSLGSLEEKVTLSKSKDKKYIFVTYVCVETLADGTVSNNTTIAMRFPAMAIDDPLLNRARAKSTK